MAKSENIYRSRRKMMLDNFLGGITWSLGVWIGTTVIIALLGFVLGKINLIPMIGNFVIRVNQFIAENGHVLTK